MTSPPDKLFRDGLEHHRKAAPASAWDRIESGLDRKRNRSPWMKIAAGLILLITTTGAILQFNRTDSSTDTASIESDIVSSSERSADPAKFKEFATGEQLAVGSLQSAVDSSQLNSIVERSRNNQLDIVNKNHPAGERTRAERSRSSRNEPSRNSLQSAVTSPQLAVSSQISVTPDESMQAGAPEPNKTSIELTSLSQAEITNEISMTEVESDSKRTSITYTAEEVNAKYLKKESTLEATPEKKNTSGLQKVIDLALDFKYEGSVLGDIREKKNELLSFNMPSNKRETNK
jgi:hypothetical protein